MNRWIVIFSIVILASLQTNVSPLQGQQVTRIDPAQLQRRMIARFRQQMEVADDAEWKQFEAAINKIFDTKRELIASQASDILAVKRSTNAYTQLLIVGTNSQLLNPIHSNVILPAMTQALADAVNTNASQDEIKEKLAVLRKIRAANEAKVAAAQEELKQLVNSRQEAIAVMSGLLR